MDINLDTSLDTSSKKSPFEEFSREELISKCKGLLIIAQKAKQAKSDLQIEVENFKIQLDNCDSEKKRALDNVKTLQELVDSLTEQKLNYITEIDTAKNNVKSLNEKCNYQNSEVEKLKKDLLTKEANMIELCQKMSDLDSELISLKRQNHRLLEENEQLINQLSELEARAAEFNDIGLQQREQLKMLEEKVHKDDEIHKHDVETLNKTIQKLQIEMEFEKSKSDKESSYSNLESKIKEVTSMYESEKTKKEKANLKLRSYKDKILKCAACINQLQNSRFILSKTVKEYSENIPKWQNDILCASKIMEKQLSEINSENLLLKTKLQTLEDNLMVAQSQPQDDVIKNSPYVEELKKVNQELTTVTSDLQEKINRMSENKKILEEELAKFKTKYEELINVLLPIQIDENKLLKDKYNDLTQKFNEISQSNYDTKNLKSENDKLNAELQNQGASKEKIENFILSLRSLETEKAILVKEKLSARDALLEIEKQNKILLDQVELFRSQTENLQKQIVNLTNEKSESESKLQSEKYTETTNLHLKLAELQEQYNLLKREHENMSDLNGLLKEEVETLKISLERPRDDAENLSDLNVSLQADIVKLESKISSYKQENNALLAEVKESRIKIKEYNVLVTDYEEAKSKLANYKSENTELLNEMKEINQVLKERGEAISKKQKAIDEMEGLIETLEKDRDALTEEKDELQKQLEALGNQLKTINDKKVEDSDNVISSERNIAIKTICEKDAVITSLKDEIDKLKQQQLVPEMSNDDNMSTSTISKAEEHARMKDLDETFEEKYTKLRIFALKLKKKLIEATTQLEHAEKDKTRLEKIINENESTFNYHKISDETDSNKVGEDKALNKLQISNLEAKVMSMTATVEQTKHLGEEINNLKSDLAAKTQTLAAEIDAHKSTKELLERARRDLKKKNVLSLEMEDYEKSLKELTTKMEENKKKMVQMESTIDTQEGTINAMKTQIKLLEEQIKSEESQNRVIKEELQNAIEDGKEKDNIICVKNNIIAKLEHDLEDLKQKNEEANIEMTSLLSDKEKFLINLGEEKAEINNKLKKLEFKYAELNEKLKVTNIELEDLKAEYTSYKVRAQAVLRQNQTVDHSQEEQLKEETAALKVKIEMLTTKLNAAQELSAEQGSEVEMARRRAAEAGAEAARAQQRTVRLHADFTRLSQEMDAERTQHKLQISTLTQCYKTQLNEMESKHQKEIEELQKRVIVNQNNKSNVVTLLDDGTSNPYLLPVVHKDEGSDGEMEINVAMIPREEGEGSEAAPSPPLKCSRGAAGAGARSPVSLERLLEDGVPEDETVDHASLSLTHEQEVAELKRKLHAQLQRVKHVTLLLSESERECARFAQLSELLKAEVRRVRGSSHAPHNTEYMKNVTFKFLTLPPGDERSRLVPVLQKILTLTNDETHKIQAIAKGSDPNARGWGSYLPWPGGK